MPKKKFSRSALQKIKLLLLDVDGVLTDGRISLTETGNELKSFHIQDGYGIVKLQRSGVEVGLITGRVSKLVKRRADELGIMEVHQNLEDKLVAYEDIKNRKRLTDGEIAYMGDDDPDLPVLQRVGFSFAPADAVDRVKRSVVYVCKRRGGHGAVREVIELILREREHHGK